MRNFIQNGDTITIVSDQIYNSGDIVVFGDIVGIANKSVIPGESLTISISGVYLLPFNPSLSAIVGDTLYYDVSEKYLTKTVNNIFVGHAWSESEGGMIRTKLIGSSALSQSALGNLINITAKEDLPLPVGDVITLQPNTVYCFLGDIDLEGCRLVCTGPIMICGTSSETSFLKSTGLTGDALITSEYTLPIRNLTITAQTVFDLNGLISPGASLDWSGVNFVNCDNLGTIQNYSSFIYHNGAFLQSGNLVFDKNFDSIVFESSIIATKGTQTGIKVNPTAVISRRMRVTDCVFNIGTDQTGINFSTSATIQPENYILNTVYFSGTGTPIFGVMGNSNKALFFRCRGIDNTTVLGHMYFAGNTNPTVISSSGIFYKAEVPTVSTGANNQKYIINGNRLINDAAIERKYFVKIDLSFTDGSNNEIGFKIFDSKFGGFRPDVFVNEISGTGSRQVGVSLSSIINHSQGDYVELWVSNLDNAQNVTITKMNFIIFEI